MKSKNERRKTIRITAFSIGVFILGAVTFNSCEKEKPVKPDPIGDQFSTKSIDCVTDCIEVGGPYLEKSDQQTIYYGPNSKTIDIIYYNTETDFVLKVKSTNGWSDLVLDGSSVWTNGPVAANVWGEYSYPLDLNWEACDLEEFTLKVTGNGPPATFNVSYDLIGLCQDCDPEFTGEAISCDNTREATYYFTSEEAQDYIKIQGGLTNFTGSDAVVDVTGGNLTVSQWTPGGSTNRIIKVEGSVDACEEIIINITWNSTNSDGIITGDWTVKDENGIELEPAVAGLECD